MWVTVDQSAIWRILIQKRGTTPSPNSKFRFSSFFKRPLFYVFPKELSYGDESDAIYLVNVRKITSNGVCRFAPQILEMAIYPTENEKDILLVGSFPKKVVKSAWTLNTSSHHYRVSMFLFN